MLLSRHTRRRDFITLGTAATAWPLVARAQQPATPVVGWISPDAPDLLQAFREGLKETEYIEHENIAIEFRPVQNQIDRLPEFAADLVRRKVNVIVAGNTASALAVKAATTTIPVVFNTPGDPVTLGIVTNLARPEGNLTGITWLAGELSAKRLGLLHELIPGAARIALLIEPNNGAITEAIVRDVEAAARPMGLQIRALNANTSSEIDAAFATIARERPRRPLRRLQSPF
jgi:putative tryptophan/tyrosine transport system substrate-binding protein